jgi:hypothetical protein
MHDMTAQFNSLSKQLNSSTQISTEKHSARYFLFAKSAERGK